MSIDRRTRGLTGTADVEVRPGALRVEDVFKIYKEGPVETVALRGASMKIESGELVAMLGRSGSGKSTLLNLIAGLDSPSAGRIWLAGHEMTNLDGAAQSGSRRRELGLVLQSGNLIPFLSAQENVELPLLLDGTDARTARIRANELLELVGLSARGRHRARELSGGEEQRVAIACALANRPALILADELTGELDSKTAQAVLDLLDSINREQQTAFLIVTHDREVAARAHRMVRIEDGVLKDARFE
jgi:lipoprotein-releasing system ATP-binding protein